MFFTRLRGALLPLLALLLALPARAQKAPAPPIQLGQVSKTDFAPTPAQLTDSTAAEYLCDYGTTELVGNRRGGFEAVHQRTARLRILRTTGYPYATVRVLLNVHNTEQAELISAVAGTTYNLVGGQPVATPLDPTQLFRKQLDKNLVECAFTLPNVKVGSIIEFTYTVTSDFLFNLTPWEFEKNIPVRWSEFRTTLPEYLTFKTITRGVQPFAVEESRTVPYSTIIRHPHLSDERLTGSALALRWVLKQVPAFHPEPLMDAPVNYRKRLSFELAGTHLDLNTRAYEDLTGQWKSLWEFLQKDSNFGRALAEPAPLAEQARNLRARFPTDEQQRAAAVLALVQRSVVFNYQGGLFATQPLRRVTELRQGSAADINLLLVQTLRAAGLNATPLLLSTRGHGQVQTAVPVLDQFDYVAAHLALPGHPDVLLDATDPQLPVGLLPERALNGQGRLADASGRWVSLAPASRYTCLSTALLRLTPQGTIEGNVRLAYLGYAALEEQQILRKSSEGAYLWAAQKQYAEWQPTHLQLDRKDTTQLPLALTMDVRVPLKDPNTNLLYVPLLHFTAPPQYPFQLPERRFPLSLGMAREHTNTATLTLPPGCTVQALPAPVNLELPGGGARFQCQVTQINPETVQLTARLQLLRPDYTPAEYANLRQLYQRAQAQYDAMVVVQRVVK